MGSALLTGLVDNGWAEPGELHVAEPDTSRWRLLRVSAPGISIDSEPCAAADAVIAVKPGDVKSVLSALTSAEAPRVLSIAAGVRSDTLEAGLPPGTPVVRCMPNTPALIGKGAAAIAAGSAADDEDLSWAAGILEAVGTVVTVAESDLDAVTGLSGSGPAYLFLLAEAMTAAGIDQGLEADVADALTRQTLLGASALLASSSDDPARLRKNVTSPGGTTEAGLAVLDDADFTGLLGHTIEAATRRSRELGLKQEQT